MCRLAKNKEIAKGKVINPFNKPGSAVHPLGSTKQQSEKRLNQVPNVYNFSP